MLKDISESEDSFVDEEEKTPTVGTKGDVGGAEGREKGSVGSLLGPTILSHGDQGEIKLEAPQQRQGKEETPQGKEEAVQSSEEQKEDGGKGDPEMAVVYIKTFLPVFADLFHTSQAAAVKKKILPVIHKLSHHVTAEWLQDLCQLTEEPSFLSQICELVALTIDSEVSVEWEGLARGGVW